MKEYVHILFVFWSKEIQSSLDGHEPEVFSNYLSKELLSAALPPDLPPSRQQDNPELLPQGQAQADEEEEEIQKA